MHDEEAVLTESSPDRVGEEVGPEDPCLDGVPDLDEPEARRTVRQGDRVGLGGVDVQAGRLGVQAENFVAFGEEGVEAREVVEPLGVVDLALGAAERVGEGPRLA
jgi:hypothetical protein